MNKIDDLLERLDRVKLARDMVPEPDGLSLSLWKLGDELAALDDDGIAALADELCITPDNVRDMARTYAR